MAGGSVVRVVKPLLVYPAPVPAELARALQVADRDFVAISSDAAVAAEQPADGWGGAIVGGEANLEEAWTICRALRGGDRVPIVLLIGGHQLDELADRHQLFDEFCIVPFHPRELDARISHVLQVAAADSTSSQLITHDDLVLNVETYQATIDGRRLELTHMEYELLKFLASSPGGQGS